MLTNKSLNAVVIGCLACEVSDVKSEKIACGNESVHIFEADVVGVYKIGIFPAERFYSGIGFLPDISGHRMDDLVFAVGLVPDWSYFHSCYFRLCECF